MVTPSPRETKSLEGVATLVLKRSEAAARVHPEVIDVVLGGSFAKRTWLPGEADIDVFVRFSKDVPEDRFEKIGLLIGQKATTGYPQGKKFSQHPYTEAEVDGFIVNIVPCYAVARKEWKSAADRSPFHVELVRERLNDQQRTDVRLLKKFLKGVGVYGAEIETEGFSGYVSEVLIMKHGSFLEVLRAFSGLKPARPEKLISLPDPVDENRDLARAISNENVAKLVLAARTFLNNPSRRFFQGLSGKTRPALQTKVVGVRFTHPRLSEDILWGELKRTMKHLKRHLEQEGFKILRMTIASDDKTTSAFLMIPESAELPELEERTGPTVEMKKQCEEFLKKNAAKAKLVWLGEDGRLHLLQDRRHLKLHDSLRVILGKRVKELGASPDLSKPLRRTAKVLSGNGLVQDARKHVWLMNGLNKIVSDSIGTGPD